MKYKTFNGGTIVKETFLEAAEILFSTNNDKSEIVSLTKDILLPRSSTMRKVELMVEKITGRFKIYHLVLVSHCN